MDNTTIGGRSVAHQSETRRATDELVTAVEAHSERIVLLARDLPNEIAGAGLGEARRSALGQMIEQGLRQANDFLGQFAAMTRGAQEAPPADAEQLRRLTDAMRPLVGRLPQASPASVQAVWQLQTALMHALQKQYLALGLGRSPGAPKGAPTGAPEGMLALNRDNMQARAQQREGHAMALPQRRPAGLQAPKMIVQALLTPTLEPPTLPQGPDKVQLFNSKVKHDPRLYGHLDLGGHTFTKIYLGDGRFFTLAATIARGAFGKIRPAIDAQGQPVAVKVVRHESKQGADKSGRSKTIPQPQEEVYNEHILTTKLRAVIDSAVAQVPLLQNVRRGCTPFINHGIVTIRSTAGSGAAQTNTYMVMSREAGDLNNLRSMLSIEAPQERKAALGAALARSVALQGFFEINALHHNCRHAHFDLSLRNLLIGHDGQIKVMDYGFATPLDRAGSTRQKGFFGSIMTPEAVEAPKAGEGPRVLTAAVDTFAMATLVFSASVLDLEVVNPFAGGQRIDRPEWADLSTAAYGQKVMELFAVWRAERQRPGSGWIVAGDIVRGPQDAIFSPFFAPLARADPRLAQLMLNGAMAQSPADRLASARVVTLLYGIAATQHPAQEELLNYFAGVSPQPDNDPIYAKARIYDAWDRAFTAQHMAQEARPVSPRPLP